MTTEPLASPTGTLRSGITTEAILEPSYAPRGLRVTWIAWDSPLRDSDLQLGDLIVAVSGAALDETLVPGKFHTAIGQANDSIGWQQANAAAGQQISLSIVREDAEVAVDGILGEEFAYFDTQGRRALAPGGPARLERDGFDPVWSSWDENMVRTMSTVLADAWKWQSMDTRQLRGELLDQAARIEALQTKYPGPYAAAMRTDWQQAVDCLGGTLVTDVDLEYRELGARRLAEVRVAAETAWAAIAGAPGVVQGFPVVPVEEAAKLADSTIMLPRLYERDWISDLGRSFAVATDSSGAYFVRLTGSAAFERGYAARSRFIAGVSPAMGDGWEFAGKASGDPVMLHTGGGVATGLVVEPTAMRCGAEGECVVDLTVADGDGTSMFAGEAALRSLQSATTPDDAAPQDVVAAMITAVKTADEKRWQSLFASWEAGMFDGQIYYQPLRPTGGTARADAWSESRERLTDEIYDVRISSIEPVRAVLQAQPVAGVPLVEGVVVWVDPVGRFGDEYRTFDARRRNRRWPLQRIDGGPWRITTVQSL